MTINLTPFDDGKLCHGYSWAVEDEDALAEQIARVAVGQAKHVGKILAGTNVVPKATTKNAIKAAVAMLTLAGESPYHRDGWMFQVMSWVAANRATPGGLIRLPQMILADKGFDGLQIELDEVSGAVVAVVVFEDKATKSPRKMISEKVWPEFEKIEGGAKENVLAAEVSSLLSMRPSVDADMAVEKIIWTDARRYRVSITIKEDSANQKGRARLFKGFPKIAAGDNKRRRGEIIVIPDLRPWMAQLADRAIAKVKALA